MISVLRQSRHSGLTPDEAAAEWVARQAGNYSSADEAAFELWLAASSANAESFLRAQVAYNIFEGADDDAHLNALRRAAREAKPQRWRVPRFAQMAMAASIAGAAFLVAYEPIFGPNSESRMALAQSSITFVKHATQKGERRIVTLDDGSVITLNTNSSIAVGFSNKRRLVRLDQGQAIFEVVKDPNRPFVVEAIDRQVVALGTIFDIRLDPGRMKLSLVEGKVLVESKDSRAEPGSLKPTLLHHGQALTAVEGSAQEVSNFNADVELLWREGLIEFNNDLLLDAVAEINRYAERPVVLRDTTAASLRISGVFRTDSAERFASVIADVLPVRTRLAESGQIEIRAR